MFAEQACIVSRFRILLKSKGFQQWREDMILEQLSQEKGTLYILADYRSKLVSSRSRLRVIIDLRFGLMSQKQWPRPLTSRNIYPYYLSIVFGMMNKLTN
jgi:hypothetical protein